MHLIDRCISLSKLEEIAQERFGDLVKAVVDIETRVMVIGGELHADEENHLLELGSQQENLWGINIYPQKKKDAWIEFDSMINIKPSQDNRSRKVENQEIQQKIIEIVQNLIQ